MLLKNCTCIPDIACAKKLQNALSLQLDEKVWLLLCTGKRIEKNESEGIECGREKMMIMTRRDEQKREGVEGQEQKRKIKKWLWWNLFCYIIAWWNKIYPIFTSCKSPIVHFAFILLTFVLNSILCQWSQLACTQGGFHQFPETPPEVFHTLTRVCTTEWLWMRLRRRHCGTVDYIYYRFWQSFSIDFALYVFIIALFNYGESFT